MSTRANTRERTNANAWKEYLLENVANNLFWDNTSFNTIIMLQGQALDYASQGKPIYRPTIEKCP